tara:strand:+ start:6419 stop:10633 length:4215 start_codon:yes stop_codon:yes gene_type:complete
MLKTKIVFLILLVTCFSCREEVVEENGESKESGSQQSSQANQEPNLPSEGPQIPGFRNNRPRLTRFEITTPSVGIVNGANQASLRLEVRPNLDVSYEVIRGLGSIVDLCEDEFGSYLCALSSGVAEIKATSGQGLSVTKTITIYGELGLNVDQDKTVADPENRENYIGLITSGGIGEVSFQVLDEEGNSYGEVDGNSFIPPDETEIFEDSNFESAKILRKQLSIIASDTGGNRASVSVDIYPKIKIKTNNKKTLTCSFDSTVFNSFSVEVSGGIPGKRFGDNNLLRSRVEHVVQSSEGNNYSGFNIYPPAGCEEGSSSQIEFLDSNNNSKIISYFFSKNFSTTIENSDDVFKSSERTNYEFDQSGEENENDESDTFGEGRLSLSEDHLVTNFYGGRSTYSAYQLINDELQSENPVDVFKINGYSNQNGDGSNAPDGGLNVLGNSGCVEFAESENYERLSLSYNRSLQKFEIEDLVGESGSKKVFLFDCNGTYSSHDINFLRGGTVIISNNKLVSSDLFSNLIVKSNTHIKLNNNLNFFETLNETLASTEEENFDCNSPGESFSKCLVYNFGESEFTYDDEAQEHQIKSYLFELENDVRDKVYFTRKIYPPYKFFHFVSGNELSECDNQRNCGSSDNLGSSRRTILNSLQTIPRGDYSWEYAKTAGLSLIGSNRRIKVTGGDSGVTVIRKEIDKSYYLQDSTEIRNLGHYVPTDLSNYRECIPRTQEHIGPGVFITKEVNGEIINVNDHFTRELKEDGTNYEEFILNISNIFPKMIKDDFDDPEEIERQIDNEYVSSRISNYSYQDFLGDDLYERIRVKRSSSSGINQDQVPFLNEDMIGELRNNQDLIRGYSSNVVNFLPLMDDLKPIATENTQNFKLSPGQVDHYSSLENRVINPVSYIKQENDESMICIQLLDRVKAGNYPREILPKWNFLNTNIFYQENGVVKKQLNSSIYQKNDNGETYLSEINPGLYGEVEEGEPSWIKYFNGWTLSDDRKQICRSGVNIFPFWEDQDSPSFSYSWIFQREINGPLSLIRLKRRNGSGYNSPQDIYLVNDLVGQFRKSIDPVYEAITANVIKTNFHPNGDNVDLGQPIVPSAGFSCESNDLNTNIAFTHAGNIYPGVGLKLRDFETVTIPIPSFDYRSLEWDRFSVGHGEIHNWIPFKSFRKRLLVYQKPENCDFSSLGDLFLVVTGEERDSRESYYIKGEDQTKLFRQSGWSKDLVNINSLFNQVGVADLSQHNITDIDYTDRWIDGGRVKTYRVVGVHHKVLQQEVNGEVSQIASDRPFILSFNPDNLESASYTEYPANKYNSECLKETFINTVKYVNRTLVFDIKGAYHPTGLRLKDTSWNNRWGIGFLRETFKRLEDVDKDLTLIGVARNDIYLKVESANGIEFKYYDLKYHGDL